MQKEIVSFSETDDSDLDKEILNALAQEHTAIQEIEQEIENKMLEWEELNGNLED